jgi:hypothetical protein
MKTNFLFPYRYKLISGIMFSISFILLSLFFAFDGYADFDIKAKVFAIVGDTSLLGESAWFSWIENGITDEILMLFVIPSGIIFAFSKEKHEDEMVATIRLNSLAWATIINYCIILLGYLFVYGFQFLNVLMVAMISQLLIFILLFRYKMFMHNTSANNEK